MKKTARQSSIRKMTLHQETVRHLTLPELGHVAGGIATDATSCIPTMLFTCHLKTPGCPM